MKSSRCLVIGLDGATFELLDPLMAQGAMPYLGGLTANGVAGPLRSTLPPVTAPAWSTFATGTNPGKHGLFSWRSPSFGTGAPVSGRDVRGRKLWHLLGDAGYTVGLVNVPLTYPPEAMNGFVMTGMMTPGLDVECTYPPELKEELLALSPDYTIDVDITESQRRLDDATEARFARFATSVLDASRARTRGAIGLAKRHQPDILVLVYTLPDRLQHSSYQYMLDAAQNLGALDKCARAGALRALITLDSELARLAKAITDEDTLTIVLSDHGFCALRRNVYLNGWLADKNLLRFLGRTASLRQSLRPVASVAKRLIPGGWLRAGRRAASADSLIDWSATQAYCGQPTEHGIHINLRGRQPNGIVESSEYDGLRSRLVSQLTELSDPLDGVRIFDAIYLREEVYHGPRTHLAPDIVFELRPGYETRQAPVPRFVVEDVSSVRRGAHAMDGVFAATGPMIAVAAEVSGACIADVAPTLLYAMDVPIPVSMDGRVLLDVFEPGFRRRRPRYRPAGVAEEVGRCDDVYGDSDASRIERRLRYLGYLE